MYRYGRKGSRLLEVSSVVGVEGTLLTFVILTDLKRELISQQVQWEIAELNSPTALQRFGAPFRSPLGEVAPVDSELPILRFIFVNHVRNFPFLDQAKEKEFWQDRLQVVCLNAVLWLREKQVLTDRVVS